MNKKGLGKGLDALMGDLSKDEESSVQQVQIEKIRNNPNQPRKHVSQEKMDELVQSIKEHGVIQPIIVRTIGNLYQLVAGERRWRAAKDAGLETIPVIVKDLNDTDVMQIALLENIQREDLNPMEKSFALQKLINEHGITQEKLSEKLGKSRSSIANSLRLLKLDKEVQDLVYNNKLSDGHARVLLALNVEQQKIAAREVVNKELSVRKTEEMVKNIKRNKKTKTKKQEKDDDVHIKEIANRLEKELGTKVNIKRGNKKGKIEIEFVKDDDLNNLVEKLLNRE